MNVCIDKSDNYVMDDMVMMILNIEDSTSVFMFWFSLRGWCFISRGCYK